MNRIRWTVIKTYSGWRLTVFDNHHPKGFIVGNFKSQKQALMEISKWGKIVSSRKLKNPRPEKLLRQHNMKVVCAYCKNHMRGNRQARKISHGICRTCEPRLYRRNPPPYNRGNALLNAITPEIYTRTIQPTLIRLKTELLGHRGKFNKWMWYRAIFKATLAAQREISRNSGEIFSRKTVTAAALEIARELWRSFNN